MRRLHRKMLTRRCRGCSDPLFHTHHLTLLGKWHYVWRWRVRHLVRGRTR